MFIWMMKRRLPPFCTLSTYHVSINWRGNSLEIKYKRPVKMISVSFHHVRYMLMSFCLAYLINRHPFVPFLWLLRVKSYCCYLRFIPRHVTLNNLWWIKIFISLISAKDHYEAPAISNRINELEQIESFPSLLPFRKQADFP